jgi:hypothetical protein
VVRVILVVREEIPGGKQKVRFLFHLLYKCPEVKSTDFKSQEKRERMVGKTVGVHAVGGEGGGGFAERKKERNFEHEIEHQTS